MMEHTTTILGIAGSLPSNPFITPLTVPVADVVVQGLGIHAEHVCDRLHRQRLWRQTARSRQDPLPGDPGRTSPLSRGRHILR